MSCLTYYTQKTLLYQYNSISESVCVRLHRIVCAPLQQVLSSVRKAATITTAHLLIDCCTDRLLDLGMYGIPISVKFTFLLIVCWQ